MNIVPRIPEFTLRSETAFHRQNIDEHQDYDPVTGQRIHRRKESSQWQHPVGPQHYKQYSTVLDEKTTDAPNHHQHERGKFEYVTSETPSCRTQAVRSEQKYEESRQTESGYHRKTSMRVISTVQSFSATTTATSTATAKKANKDPYELNRVGGDANRRNVNKPKFIKQNGSSSSPKKDDELELSALEVSSAPLDHSLQIGKKNLSINGSLSKRRRPTRSNLKANMSDIFQPDKATNGSNQAGNSDNNRSTSTHKDECNGSGQSKFLLVEEINGHGTKIPTESELFSKATLTTNVKASLQATSDINTNSLNREHSSNFAPTSKEPDLIRDVKFRNSSFSSTQNGGKKYSHNWLEEAKKRLRKSNSSLSLSSNGSAGDESSSSDCSKNEAPALNSAQSEFRSKGTQVTRSNGHFNGEERGKGDSSEKRLTVKQLKANSSECWVSHHTPSANKPFPKWQNEQINSKNKEQLSQINQNQNEEKTENRRPVFTVKKILRTNNEVSKIEIPTVQINGVSESSKSPAQLNESHNKTTEKSTTDLMDESNYYDSQRDNPTKKVRSSSVDILEQNHEADQCNGHTNSNDKIKGTIDVQSASILEKNKSKSTGNLDDDETMEAPWFQGPTYQKPNVQKNRKLTKSSISVKCTHGPTATPNDSIKSQLHQNSSLPESDNSNRSGNRKGNKADDDTQTGQSTKAPWMRSVKLKPVRIKHDTFKEHNAKVVVEHDKRVLPKDKHSTTKTSMLGMEMPTTTSLNGFGHQRMGGQAIPSITVNGENCHVEPQFRNGSLNEWTSNSIAPKNDSPYFKINKIKDYCSPSSHYQNSWRGLSNDNIVIIANKENCTTKTSTSPTCDLKYNRYCKENKQLIAPLPKSANKETNCSKARSNDSSQNISVRLDYNKTKLPKEMSTRSSIDWDRFDPLKSRSHAGKEQNQPGWLQEIKLKKLQRNEMLEDSIRQNRLLDGSFNSLVNVMDLDEEMTEDDQAENKQELPTKSLTKSPILTNGAPAEKRHSIRIDLRFQESGDQPAEKLEKTTSAQKIPGLTANKFHVPSATCPNVSEQNRSQESKQTVEQKHVTVKSIDTSEWTRDAQDKTTSRITPDMIDLSSRLNNSKQKSLNRSCKITLNNSSPTVPTLFQSQSSTESENSFTCKASLKFADNVRDTAFSWDEAEEAAETDTTEKGSTSSPVPQSVSGGTGWKYIALSKSGPKGAGSCSSFGGTQNTISNDTTKFHSTKFYGVQVNSRLKPEAAKQIASSVASSMMEEAKADSVTSCVPSRNQSDRVIWTPKNHCIRSRKQTQSKPSNDFDVEGYVKNLISRRRAEGTPNRQPAEPEAVKSPTPDWLNLSQQKAKCVIDWNSLEHLNLVKENDTPWLEAVHLRKVPRTPKMTTEETRIVAALRHVATPEQSSSTSSSSTSSSSSPTSSTASMNSSGASVENKEEEEESEEESSYDNVPRIRRRADTGSDSPNGTDEQRSKDSDSDGPEKRESSPARCADDEPEWMQVASTIRKNPVDWNKLEHTSRLTSVSCSSSAPWVTQVRLRSPSHSPSRPDVEPFRVPQIELKPVIMPCIRSQAIANESDSTAAATTNAKCVNRKADDYNSKSRVKAGVPSKRVTFCIPKACSSPELREEAPHPEWVKIAEEKCNKRIKWEELEKHEPDEKGKADSKWITQVHLRHVPVSGASAEETAPIPSTTPKPQEHERPKLPINLRHVETNHIPATRTTEKRDNCQLGNRFADDQSAKRITIETKVSVLNNGCATPKTCTSKNGGESVLETDISGLRTADAASAARSTSAEVANGDAPSWLKIAEQKKQASVDWEQLECRSARGSRDSLLDSDEPEPSINNFVKLRHKDFGRQLSVGPERTDYNSVSLEIPRNNGPEDDHKTWSLSSQQSSKHSVRWQSDPQLCASPPSWFQLAEKKRNSTIDWSNIERNAASIRSESKWLQEIRLKSPPPPRPLDDKNAEVVGCPFDVRLRHVKELRKVENKENLNAKKEQEEAPWTTKPTSSDTDKWQARYKELFNDLSDDILPKHETVSTDCAAPPVATLHSPRNISIRPRSSSASPRKSRPTSSLENRQRRRIDFNHRYYSLPEMSSAIPRNANEMDIIHLPSSSATAHTILETRTRSPIPEDDQEDRPITFVKLKPTVEAWKEDKSSNENSSPAWLKEIKLRKIPKSYTDETLHHQTAGPSNNESDLGSASPARLMNAEVKPLKSISRVESSTPGPFASLSTIREAIHRDIKEEVARREMRRSMEFLEADENAATETSAEINSLNDRVTSPTATKQAAAATQQEGGSSSQKKPIWLEELRQRKVALVKPAAALSSTSPLRKSDGEENGAVLSTTKAVISQASAATTQAQRKTRFPTSPQRINNNNPPPNANVLSPRPNGSALSSSPSFESVLQQIKTMGREKLFANLRRDSSAYSKQILGDNINVGEEARYGNDDGDKRMREEGEVARLDNIPSSNGNTAESHLDPNAPHRTETISHTTFVLSPSSARREVSLVTIRSSDMDQAARSSSEAGTDVAIVIQDDGHDNSNASKPFAVQRHGRPTSVPLMLDRYLSLTGGNPKTRNDKDKVNVIMHPASDADSCPVEALTISKLQIVQKNANTSEFRSEDDASELPRARVPHVEVAEFDYSTATETSGEHPEDLKSPMLLINLLSSLSKSCSDTNLTKLRVPASAKMRFEVTTSRMTSSCSDIATSARNIFGACSLDSSSPRKRSTLSIHRFRSSSQYLLRTPEPPGSSRSSITMTEHEELYPIQAEQMPRDDDADDDNGMTTCRSEMFVNLTPVPGSSSSKLKGDDSMIDNDPISEPSSTTAAEVPGSPPLMADANHEFLWKSNLSDSNGDFSHLHLQDESSSSSLPDDSAATSSSTQYLEMMSDVSHSEFEEYRTTREETTQPGATGPETLPSSSGCTPGAPVAWSSTDTEPFEDPK